MALLGTRVPIGLKVFLTALAIVDDIAAVLVIAVFYTVEVSVVALGVATACLAFLFLLALLGARQPLTYVLGGVVLWLAVLASGIHATIAGVALAMVIPSRTRLDSRQFLARSRRTLDHFELNAEGNLMTNEEQQAAIHGLEEACEKVQPPLHRISEGIEHQQRWSEGVGLGNY
jgi:NhaA family Na+:H+ antiporter